MPEDRPAPPLPPEPPPVTDGALREAFADAARDRSVLERIERMAGRKARVLLHDLPDDESPLLRPYSLAPGRDRPQDDARYRIVGEIARGGIGVVHKARDVDLGREVALKVLREDKADDKEVFARFVEEAQIGAQLQHPGIVPVYGLGLQPDGLPYFAMKLIKGRTLAALLKERADVWEGRRKFLEIFEHVCQTMGYAHSRGVIHRDLKPTNVMVGGFGEVQVVDWGFGKVLGREDRTAERLVERTVIATVRSQQPGSDSLAGSVMGTPAYMPPEQALGHVAELDAQSDVFSLGAILCEVLTGEPPYTGPHKDLLVKAAQGRLEETYGRLDGCGADPALVDLARRCLAPMRSERPADAGELAHAVADHLASVEHRARQAEIDAVEQEERLRLEQRRAAWERRSKWRVRAAAAVLLVGVATAVGVYLRSDAARARRVAEARPTIEQALQDARLLRSQERWADARAAARRALDLAATGGVDDDLRSRAAELAARVEEGWDRANAAQGQREREAEFVEELEDVRLGLGDRFDVRSTDLRYGDVFGELDAARLSADYPGVITEIAAALDEWAWLRRSFRELEGTDWQSLVAVARTIDPDPWRTRMRDAVAAKDLDALHALVEEVKDLDLPVRTLDMLGVALWRAGDPEAARRFYVELQRAHPDDFWVNFRAGVWSSGDRNPGSKEVSDYFPDAEFDAAGAGEAVRYLTAALALRPGSTVALVELGLAFQHMSPPRLEDAARAFRRATRLRPDFAMAHYDLGNVLLAAREFDKAEVAYRMAIDLNPDDPWPHYALGIVLGSKGDLPGAIDAYRNAVDLQPDMADAQYNLGCVLSATGDREGAVTAYEAAIRSKPDYAEAHCNLGDVLTKLGRFREALESYRRGDELGSRRPTWPYPSRQCVERMERIVAVEGMLPDLLSGKVEPRGVRQCLGFAELCYEKSKHATSADLYARALDLDPSLAEDLRAGHRYSAACAAVLAGTPEWRGRALQELRADLKLRAEQGMGRSVRQWLHDPDLASVRDEDALATLPEVEQEQWRALWKDVAASFQEASK